MKMLDWKSASKDELPDHSERVLISIEGVNYLATYNAKEKTFEDVSSDSCFWVRGDQTIYWSEIANPVSYQEDQRRAS
jgi:hypothetical protein